jgi:hypothetical protein
MIDRHHLRPFVKFRNKIYALDEPQPGALVIIEEDKIQDIE